jgi:hypothetical protein
MSSLDDYKTPKRCIYKRTYYLRDCYYFIESKRPKNLQLNKAIQEKSIKSFKTIKDSLTGSNI